MLLTDKVAIVTGAGRGTGATIARRFAEEGATVVVVDILDPDGRATADSLGPPASFHACDITDEGAWATLVQHVVEAHGRIDVLVNNAAILHMAGIDNTTAATFRRVLEVNTLGAFLGIRAVVPTMRAQGGGSIVNLASIDALQGMNGLSAYTASKWGLRGLTKAAAVELGRDNIRVNAVCPAGGNPTMYGPWSDKLAGLTDEIAAYHHTRAIHRNVTLDEIANAVVYLASDLAGMVTGVDIPVDGGGLAGHHVVGFNDL